jgi:hypothetical protein
LLSPAVKHVKFTGSTTRGKIHVCYKESHFTEYAARFFSAGDYCPFRNRVGSFGNVLIFQNNVIDNSATGESLLFRTSIRVDGQFAR